MARKSKYKWWEKYIFARARVVWRWSPVRKAAIQRATRDGKIFCELCEEHIKPVLCYRKVKGVRKPYWKVPLDVDHIIPVVDVTEGFIGWDNYFARLYEIPLENLCVVCKPCHKVKTGTENERRNKKK